MPDTYKNPQHYDEDAAPSQYQHGDTWFRDMRTPSFEGRLAPNNDNSVQWLASEIADDPRFPTAAVKFWWPALMGSPPVEAPEVTTDVTFTRQLNAFEAQNAFINHLGEAFEAGINGGSAFNGKDLLVELMMSPWFRADRAATEADRENYVTQMGTRRLLSPEELEAKGEALFGWRWGHYDNQVQEYEFDGAWTSLGNEYRIYYGGIDSEGVVERSNALTSVMSNVAQKHSLEVACPAVMIDFERPNNQRLLFKDIEPSITPENGEVQIREKIAELHNKLWGVRHSPDDPEVIATYSVLVDVRANRTQWMQQEGHGDWAYVYPFESCNFYLAEHWEDGGIGHRGADPTFMKNAWMAVITYLTSDFQYLHE